MRVTALPAASSHHQTGSICCGFSTDKQIKYDRQVNATRNKIRKLARRFTRA